MLWQNDESGIATVRIQIIETNGVAPPTSRGGFCSQPRQTRARSRQPNCLTSMPCMGAANTSGVRLVARTATQRRHSDGFRTKLMNQLFTKVGFGTWLMVPPEQPCLCSETASDKALLRVRFTRWNAKWSLWRYPTDGKIFTEV